MIMSDKSGAERFPILETRTSASDFSTSRDGKILVGGFTAEYTRHDSKRCFGRAKAYMPRVGVGKDLVTVTVGVKYASRANIERELLILRQLQLLGLQDTIVIPFGLCVEDIHNQPGMVLPYLPYNVHQIFKWDITGRDSTSSLSIIQCRPMKWFIPQLRNALNSLHRHGYAHCDLKPANMRVVSKYPRQHQDFSRFANFSLKLIDLETANEAASSARPNVGTKFYRASDYFGPQTQNWCLRGIDYFSAAMCCFRILFDCVGYTAIRNARVDPCLWQSWCGFVSKNKRHGLNIGLYYSRRQLFNSRKHSSDSDKESPWVKMGWLGYCKSLRHNPPVGYGKHALNLPVFPGDLADGMRCIDADVLRSIDKAFDFRDALSPSQQHKSFR